MAGGAKADDKSRTEKAAALFAEGRRLMSAENYAAACSKLAESQALDPEPDTAFDLGICYQKASQAAFKTARELAGGHDSTSDLAAVPSGLPAPKAGAAPPGQTQRVIGITMGGVGAAGIVAGLIVGLVAKSKYDDAASACDGSACRDDMVSLSRSATQLGRASTFSFLAGAAVLAGGAVVFFTAPKTADSAAVGLAPAAESAGLSIAGRF
jgi:hypothetical protein